MTTLGHLIPLFPLLGAIACCFVGYFKCGAFARLAGPLCVVSVAASFVVTALLAVGGAEGGATAWTWMQVGGLDLSVRWFFDPLTLIMLCVVTGVGSIIAWYALGYMEHDDGYARFFGAVALFIFAMTTLVMADNLVLLFVGWEGVGVCSYLLIGHYFQKDVAVAAAKKAFVVNRVGDFCLLLGMFLLFQEYGTLSLHGTEGQPGVLSQASSLLAASGGEGSDDGVHTWIAMLLMLGAFGKSAQFPLFVWLPDAMAGPTPVSALVHAATMVTSGVYLVVRMLPVFQLSPCALVTIAVIGGFTALLGATIALCSNDLKGVFAYSTVSQLGYMFVGVGAVSAGGAIQHLYTHAFFKALLFLTAGSVMHALAGKLDIRTMSGLRHRLPVTCWLMFVGCLALAGFPLISAGFWSKDLILADVMAVGLNDWRGYGTLYLIVAWSALLTALLTAFYTFRVWFTVFMGQEKFEMGDEHHHAHDDHAADEPADLAHTHDAPDEMPWLPMNLPLVVLALGSTVLGMAIWWGAAEPFDKQFHYGNIAAVESGMTHAGEDTHAGTGRLSDQSEHAYPPGKKLHHADFLGGDVHTTMLYVSGAIALIGIAGAAFFHWLARPARDTAAKLLTGPIAVLRGKWYVDEIYDAVIVKPLHLGAQLLYVLDALVVEGATRVVGLTPKFLGGGIRPVQTGRMQAYGLSMALGVALLALVVLIATTLGSAGS
ncbi:MAG: NADH-quinone oxidoreductase subunit L [Planctomycetota bacterium]